MSIRTIRSVQAGSAGNVHPLLVADDRQSLDSQLPKLTPNPELYLNFALPEILSKLRIDSILIPPLQFFHYNSQSSVPQADACHQNIRSNIVPANGTILAFKDIEKINKPNSERFFYPLITVDDGAGTHYFPDRSFKHRRVDIVLTTEGEKENVK